MTYIHFCWFGSQLPQDLAARLARWQKLHPSWALRQWNESSIDLIECAYAQACLCRKDWAYLSDCVRLQALAKEGGVYLDNPIDLFKPLDGCFRVDYLNNFAQSIAMMVSPPQQPLFAKLIQRYPAPPVILPQPQAWDALGLHRKSLYGLNRRLLMDVFT